MLTPAYSQNDDLLFGAYVYGGVWGGAEPIVQAERLIGAELDIVQWFMNWDHAFDASLVDSVSRQGRIPLITWEPTNASVAAIAAGRHDAYIASWARGVRSYGEVIYLRPFPEMNGDWAPWNGDPEGLVTAWRRMVDIFDAEGADNVRWIWSPNVTDEPATEANRMESYYPGTEYVDVLALDGYNWGTSRSWSAWQSFDEVFEKGYRRIEVLGGQPVWFTEVASSEKGGDKGAWIRDMMSSTAFERLEALVWFHESKEADWRFNSSDMALAAIREAVAPAMAIASSSPFMAANAR